MSESHKSKHLVIAVVVVVSFILGLGLGMTADSDLFQGKIRGRSRTVRTTEEAKPPQTNTSTQSPAGALGTIQVAAAPNPIWDDKIIAGSSGVPVARFVIIGTGEDFVVDELTFENDSLNDNLYENDAAIQQLHLWYSDDFGNTNFTTSKLATLVGGVAHFTNLNLAVPASIVNENARTIEIWADTIPLNLARNSGWQIEMDFKAGGAFSATGQTSMATVTQASMEFLTVSDVDAHEIALYRSLPVFAKHTGSSSVCPSDNMDFSSSGEIYCFKVSAASTGGDIGLYKWTFDVVENNLDTDKWSVPGAFQLFKYDITGAISAMPVASGAWDPASSKATLTVTGGEEWIAANSTQFYVLRAPTPIETSPIVDAIGSISTRLAAETSFDHLPETTAASATGLQIWSDESATSSANHLTMPDWTNAYKLEELPSQYLMLSE